MNHHFFTSESVAEGHPDKLCDCVADAILDALLTQDPNTRCACEVTCEPGVLRILGEVTTKAVVDYNAVARSVLREIGYTRPEYGFDADTVSVDVSLHEQSPDIAMGVNRALEERQGGEQALGAGDQGMMFGYACDETPALMPMPIELAHALTAHLTSARKSGRLPYLRPDGKAQVTVEYADGVPLRVDAVVLSAQHDPDADMEQLRAELKEQVIRPAIPAHLLDERTRVFINPTGRFVLGGPAADTGLTGRKIIVDTYGGYARHGGGAFSGKDPTKVDRSACYMARWLAKNIVAARMARRCEVQLSYAIGMAQPVSFDVNTFGTGSVPDEVIAKTLRETIPMTPQDIITRFQLRRPIYAQTAAYGHFGYLSSNMPWERLDMVTHQPGIREEG